MQISTSCRLRHLAFLALFAGSLHPLRAQANDTEATVELEMQARMVAAASLSPDGGQLSQSVASADLFVPVAGSGSFGVGVDLIAEHASFRFRDFDRFIPGTAAPLSSATRVVVQPTLLLTPTEQWNWVISASGESFGASGARFSQSFLASGSVAGVYGFGKDRKIGLGIQVQQRMPNSLRVLPFPIIDWHFGPWSLTALDGETGRLSYEFTPKTSVYGQLEFRSRDIRFATKSSITAGILRYEAFPAYLGVQLNVNRHLTCSAFGGLILAQQYGIEDQHGHFMRDSSQRSPFCGGLDLDWSL